MECKIEGCEKPKHNIHGWCVKHYQQWRRHGDPEWRDKKSKVCSVEECERKHYCRGFCSMHHQRWFKYGDPLAKFTMLGESAQDRFWAKVDKTPGQGPQGDCWMWIGGKDNDGYGIFRADDNPNAKAHRIAYEWATGDRLGEFQCLHHCDEPSCVRDSHLFKGTGKDNMQDMLSKGRDNYVKGEECHSAKLTKRKVKNILNLKDSSLSHAAIARRYGVTPSAISLIFAGKTWKHI